MDLQTENTDILQTIVAHKQQEVDEWMRFMPPRQLMAKVEERMAKEEQPPASMRQALLQSDKIGRATSELQSHSDLVCRLLLEKKKEGTASFCLWTFTSHWGLIP